MGEGPIYLVFFRYHYTSLTGDPLIKLRTLFTAISIILVRASFVAQAICGVMMQFSAESSGLSAEGGSVESTSNPAPAICSRLSASAKSCSSINCPLEVLIKKADFRSEERRVGKEGRC